jgi:hypothetical protein
MERIVNKARGFAAADEWDIRQQVALTPQQRQRAARELKRRVHGPISPDVRACHPKR